MPCSGWRRWVRASCGLRGVPSRARTVRCHPLALRDLLPCFLRWSDTRRTPQPGWTGLVGAATRCSFPTVDAAPCRAAPPRPASGVMFSATQTVQLLYRCVLRLLGTPAEHAAAEEAFAQSAAWGASVEAVLVARGVVLSTLGTDGQEAEARAAAEATDPLRGD